MNPDSSGNFDGKIKMKIGYYFKSNKVYPIVTICDDET